MSFSVKKDQRGGGAGGGGGVGLVSVDGSTIEGYRQER